MKKLINKILKEEVKKSKIFSKMESIVELVKSLMVLKTFMVSDGDNDYELNSEEEYNSDYKCREDGILSKYIKYEFIYEDDDEDERGFTFEFWDCDENHNNTGITTMPDGGNNYIIIELERLATYLNTLPVKVALEFLDSKVTN